MAEPSSALFARSHTHARPSATFSSWALDLRQSGPDPHSCSVKRDWVTAGTDPRLDFRWLSLGSKRQCLPEAAGGRDGALGLPTQEQDGCGVGPRQGP